METAEFIREMSKVELRLPPRVSIHLHESPGVDGVTLLAALTCEDSVHEGEMTEVNRYRIIHGHIIAKVPREEWRGLFITNLYVLLQDLYQHEIDEWFMVDGKHYHDPHPELRHVTPVATEGSPRP